MAKLNLPALQENFVLKKKIEGRDFHSTNIVSTNQKNRMSGSGVDDV